MARKKTEPTQEEIRLIKRLIKHLWPTPDSHWSPEEIAKVLPISGRTLRRWRDGDHTKPQGPTKRDIVATLRRPLLEILRDASIPYLPDVEDTRPLEPPRLPEVMGDED